MWRIQNETAQACPEKNSLSKLPVKLSFLEAFFCFFYPIFSLFII